MKKSVQKILFHCSKAILAKYKPKVIAITGSIGKTSAKEAIFGVVSAKYSARKNIKNYNNEFGVPFTIIGVESPKRNIFKWLALFLKCFWLVYFWVDYPKVLVLELGIDKPGDMDALMDIVKPDIAVLTTIGISHSEFLGSEQQIFAEKIKIFRDLAQKDFAILNFDDAKAREAASTLKTKIISYGQNPDADLQVVGYKTIYSEAGGTYGTSIDIKYKNQNANIFLENCIGLPHVSAVACAAAVGLAMHQEFSEIAAALANYLPLPGRLRLIPGINKSTIIDDSYNSAPLSVNAAIDELANFSANKKIVALGDMLELGKYSEQAHKDVAKKIVGSTVNYAIFVGPLMKIAFEELKRLDFDKENIFWFEKSEEAISAVKNLLGTEAVILIKGSQGSRMEKIVRATMAEPAKAAKLLCRQEPDWLEK